MKIFPSRGNWGLKLLALILAVVIYLAMKDASRDVPPFIMKGSSPDAAAR